MMRTSLYADDAAIFMAPIKSDVDNLATILKGFGDVTGLCTNFHKSSVVPIRCANVDLDHVLSAVPVSRATFPMKYLGLPLSVWQLKTVDFQYLEDKAASKRSFPYRCTIIICYRCWFNRVCDYRLP